MALLFMDGFDHYATADILKKWTALVSSPAIQSGAGRRGGGALETSGTKAVTKTLPGAYSTLIVGMAISPSALPTSTAPTIIRLLDAGTLQIAVRYNLDGTLSVLRNTTLLGTSAATLPAGGYSYVEIKVTISDAAGAYDVLVNGASILSASGVDTKNTANATANQVSIGFSNNQAVSVLLWDDLYIANTSGSENNDVLGDSRIDTLYPTSDGNYSQFTPSAGTDHYAMVDETAPSAADYNESATLSHRDSYGLGNLPALASDTVYGVQVNASMLKDDAGARSVSTMVRTGVSNGDGATAALSVSETYISQIYEMDPGTAAAWIASGVNAMEAGVRIAA